MSKKSRPSTRPVKEILYQLYGKKCMVCERKFSKLEGHHIVEFAKGGATNLENIGLICPNCHRELHTGGKKEEYNRKIRSYKAKIDLNLLQNEHISLFDTEMP